MSRPTISKDNDKKSLGKLTTSEEEKEILYEKLITNDAEGLRKMNIKQLDLNIFQPVEDLEFIDEKISPLAYCAFYGKTDLAKLLFQNKIIDIDLQTPSNKHTPLIVACLGSNYQIAKFLIDKGAQVNKPNLFFHTPLIVILNRLIEEYQSFQQNRICLRIAQMLILNGADPNWVFQKQKGYNLLHFLCSIKTKMNKSQKQLNYDLIKFLINHGANINQKTLTDKKPIDLLDSHCNADALRQLFIKAQQMKQNRTNKKDNNNTKSLVRMSKVNSNLKNDMSLSKIDGYSRDDEVEWYKTNLLNIHGIKKD